MKRIFSYIIGLSVFSTLLCEGAGIVAWKERAFHEDSMAKIATYSRRKLSGNKGIFNVKGKDIYLPENLYWYIDIPNGLPSEFSDSFQYEMLLKQKYEMGVFRKRFPKSSAILDPWLKRLQEYQDNYDSGKRFVNGVWMEKSAYEQQQAAQREKRNQRRLQEEQKRKEADKNTVGTGSRSAGREEKSRISYADGSLKEIGDGSVEGARTVLKRLEQSKKSLDPAGRNQAEQLIQSIKRLFTAQSAYKKALQQQAGAKAKAEQYERQAENNMRPNPLTGEPNSYMANRARKQAREIVLNAEHVLTSGKRELLQALKQSDTLACTLYKTIPQDAESLALAVAAIAESYHGEIDFRSRFEEVRDEEDRRQEELAREQEEREQQLAREKEEERLREEREQEERCLREKREEIARQREERTQQIARRSQEEERKAAEENMDAVKAPFTPSHPTVPDRPEAPAAPPIKYMSATDANRMVYRTLGSLDPRALEGIDEKYRNIIQTSTDPVEIVRAAEEAYADKGYIDPAMRQYLINMAHYRALSNKTGQGTAYHPSLARSFPSLPSVMEMGDYSWEEEVDKMIAASKDTYNPYLSLACRQRARDIIEARSRIMGGSMDRPEDIYRRRGISKDTDPVSEDTNSSSLSGMALPLIFLGLLIVFPLGIFLQVAQKIVTASRISELNFQIKDEKIFYLRRFRESARPLFRACASSSP